MHGTGKTPNSVLLDPDIHGIVARTLERHIDVTLNGEPTGQFAPRAVQVFANGAEGDVSPDWPAGSRCDTRGCSPSGAIRTVRPPALGVRPPVEAGAR